MELLKGHIPYIEKALGFKLYDHQKDYLFDGMITNRDRGAGHTTAYCIELALSDGPPIDPKAMNRYSDRGHLPGNHGYAQTYFRPLFLDIRQKLKDGGFTVRPLKGDDIVGNEKQYKVSLWFGEASDNAEEHADKVIYVTTKSSEKREITALALRQLKEGYPRSYQVLVEESDTIEMYVVKIEGSKRALADSWYHDRDGELFVVRKNRRKPEIFETCHLLGNTGTIGYIPETFCTIVNTFQAEDTF